MYKNYYKKNICLFVLILLIGLSEVNIAQELIYQVKSERSALTTALLFEQYETARTLIDEGAHIDECDKNIVAGPFLAWSIEKNQCGFIRLLDEMHAVDLSRVFPDGTTALHSAVKHQAPAVLRYLVQQKQINLNQQRTWNLSHDDKRGFTALHYAVKQQNMSAAQLLIEAGADVTIKDSDENIASNYAENSEMKELFGDEDNEGISSETIEKKLAYEKEKIEMIADFKEVFTQQSYPFLEENFRAFNLNFKIFVIQLLDNEQATNSVFDNNTEDLQCSFDSCIKKAEEKLVQELALKLSAESIDRMMQDPNLKGVISNPIILKLALVENDNQLLLQFLTKPCNNKVIKSLFIDTGLIHSLPVLYLATDLDTLKFLVDHGAGQEESPKNFHAYVYTKKLQKEELQKTLQIDNSHQINYFVKNLDERLDMILLCQSILTLGLACSVKNQDYKKRRMDAIVLEAKKTSKDSVHVYLGKRERQEEQRSEQVFPVALFVGGSILMLIMQEIILHNNTSIERNLRHNNLFYVLIPMVLILRPIALTI